MPAKARVGDEARPLLESERGFRLLVEGVVDYAIYMLDPSGIIANWNSGAERIKGYRAKEVVGQHFGMFYAPQDRAAGLPIRSLETARRTGRFAAEGWRVRKDGTFFWASVVIDPIRDDDGELIGFAKITRDITERRDAQLALDKVQRQLAESQKMDALGQLTGGVAHDFNNLLMIVTGHLHALKRIAREDAKAMRAVQAIEVAAQRGAHLTRQLLTFSRRQHVRPSTVDLRSCIESIREVLGSALGSNVQLVIDIPETAWRTVVDVNELEVALLNLVVNARDAMPDGGVVTVAAENAQLQEEGELAGGDYVALSVKDTGLGIPPDVLGKVFDPFFTTKPVGKGTGLGLSQVHGFVHQAGGTVRIASGLGEGTIITLYLPRLRGEEEGSEIAAAENHRKGTGTVLLVEDNPEVANASTGLIEQLGYAVRWVPTAEAALRELEKDGVDLVFSDVVMPGLDGLGLARIVRRLHPSMPILLATGYSEAAQRVHTDFPILRKPYELHELGRELAKLIRA